MLRLFGNLLLVMALLGMTTGSAFVVGCNNGKKTDVETCSVCGNPMAECTCEKGETCAKCGNVMAECTCPKTDDATCAKCGNHD